MDVGTLGIIEVNDTPPLLDLMPEEVAALADELVPMYSKGEMYVGQFKVVSDNS